MALSKFLNPADRAAGVYAYIDTVSGCPNCGAPTNLIFLDSVTGMPVRRCSARCKAKGKARQDTNGL
jgi:hypothetical protein